MEKKLPQKRTKQTKKSKIISAMLFLPLFHFYGLHLTLLSSPLECSTKTAKSQTIFSRDTSFDDSEMGTIAMMSSSSSSSSSDMTSTFWKKFRRAIKRPSLKHHYEKGSEVSWRQRSKKSVELYNGAIAERSRARVCSGFVVGVPGSNPTWGGFFLNKKKFVFLELDGEPSWSHIVYFNMW